MPGRTALVLTTSTLHHRRGVSSAVVLERQVRLLRATGHERVLLLGRKGWCGVDSEWIADPSEAADRLTGADRVTVLGHAVVLTEAAVHSALAVEGLATREPAEGWERIDAADGWAGVLSAPAALVVDALRRLGEWDAQGTLLRRAVQAGLPRIRVGNHELAHGFAPDEWHRLLNSQRADRLAFGPRLLSPPAQAVADRLALRADDRSVWAVPLTISVTLALLALAAGASLAGTVWLAAATLPPLTVGAGVAVSVARLNRVKSWPLAVAALAGVVGVPLGLAFAKGGELPVVTSGIAAVLAAMLLMTSHRRGGLWLDLCAVAIGMGLLSIGAVATVLLAAPVLLLLVTAQRASRRRLRAVGKRWRD